MNNRSRLGLQRLEERDTPASFSALLSGGAVVSGSFSTPDGVDPAQSSQVVELTDLSAVRGGVSYTAAPVPLAYYSYGALTGVAANLFGPDDQIDLYSNGTAVFTPASGPTETGSIAYDVADAQATFTLSDGTVGSISYQIPWSQVDPSQSSQSLSPTAFNLNIAGQNFTYGTANYTTAPTLAFANGDLTGFAFAVNLAGTGSPYSSVSVSNGVATAVVAATSAVLNAPIAAAGSGSLTLDFSNIVLPPAGANAQPQTYTINLYYSGDKKVVLEVEAQPGATAQDIRNLFATACGAKGVKSTNVGTTQLNIAGAGDSLLKEVIPGPFYGNIHPKLIGRAPGSDGTLPDYTP